MKALAIRNGIWNALANAAGALTGIVGSIVVVRSLTPSEYGTFSYYIWLAGILGILGTLAFPNAVTKITSELRGDQQTAKAYLLSYWVIAGLLTINVLLSVVLVVWALSTPLPQRIYLLIISAVIAPNALMAVLRSTLWGREQYRPVALTMVIGSLLQLGFVALAYVFDWGVPGFLAALFSTTLVQAAGLAVVLRIPFSASRMAAVTFHRPEPELLRRYLAFAFPATLVLCYEVVVWQRSEIFFLERFSTLEQVGFYNLAYTFFGMILALGWALLHGFYPAISRHYGASEWFQIHEKVRQGLIFACLFAVPMTFGGWAILHNLTTLLYTAKMAAMVPVAQVLLVGLLPGVMTGLFSILVNAVGGIWIQVRLGLIMALVSLGLDLLLIPRFAALGGAIANTSTQVAYSLLLLAIIRRKYKIMLPARAMIAIIVVGALTTFVVPTLLQIWVPGLMGLMGAIMVAAPLYTATIFFLGYFRSLNTVELPA